MSSPMAPTSLRQRQIALERILTGSAQPVEDLAALGSPQDLHLLFYVQLCTTVRMGPAADTRLTPDRILSVAQQAAGSGLLPLSTLPALRQCLDELESRLVQAGAWHPDEALWWHPLPPPTPLEDLWQEWREAADAPFDLPPGDQIMRAFAGARTVMGAGASAGTPAAPGYLSLPRFLDDSLALQLYREATASHSDSVLALKQGGVGSSDRISASRWDWTGFFSGTEATLLQAAPTLSAFVQWCLDHLGELLADAVPGKEPFPPQKVMLARYPAPSGGYAAHLDNPGAPTDNGRTLTLVVYLNPPEEACAGGELAVWAPEAGEGD
ncbi:MAG: 2OG-Fe(II) oxygenase, partial [Anaerolineae bacterium]